MSVITPIDLRSRSGSGRVNSYKFNYQIKALCKQWPHLPQPTRKIGSGAFGTAFDTTDPKWVIKVTSTYAREFHLLQSFIKSHPERTCKILHMMYDVPGNPDIYLIWKEKCKPLKDWNSDMNELINILPSFDDQVYNVGYNQKGVLVVFDP